MKRTALLSVYDKTGIVEAAKRLRALDIDIIASAGTAKELRAAGIEAKEVSELTGLPPILGHRVVTLAPQIHAGLLARLDSPEHMKELEDLGIPAIHILFADLYPLKDAIAAAGATLESVIEKTDIGGPTMIRSAAKGNRLVAATVEDRERIIAALEAGGDTTALAMELAGKAEAVIADYVLASARYRSAGNYDGVVGTMVAEAKYGENAWQTPAGLYAPVLQQAQGKSNSDPLSLSRFTLAAGTAPSYNNWCDVDRMLQNATHIAAAFEINRGKVPCIAVGVKHGNACGAAVGNDKKEVLQKMLEGSLRAIFGGLVLVNFEIDENLAEVLLTHKVEKGRRLLDGIVAPAFAPGALEMLRRSGDKCRFLANPALASLSKDSLDAAPRFRYTRGGFLKQPNYTFVPEIGKAQKSVDVDEARENDLLLAWAVGSTSNSNTVTIVKNGQLLGNGVGQQDRVGGAELAIRRAAIENHDVRGAAAYSDSFFPFPDGALALADAGITAIFSTSGSKNDQMVQDALKERGIALYLLPDSEARGFFGH